jgi:uncharacterized sulfatase
MPTLCRLAGYEQEEDLAWDGGDIWPLLAGGTDKPAPRTLYWKFVRGQAAIRRGDWKLIVQQGKPDELFDLAADPCEKTNLATRHPGRVGEFKALLAEQRKRDK